MKTYSEISDSSRLFEGSPQQREDAALNLEPPLMMDTDIVSMMGRKRPPPGLRPWLLQVGIARLGISFPTIAELRRGAHLILERHPERSAAISEWVDEVLATDFHFFAMPAGSADIYARMTATPELRSMWTVQRGEKHNRLGHDLLIAAIAISHGSVILTANIRDYLRIHEKFPLPGLYNPTEGRWYVRPKLEMVLPALDPLEQDPHASFLPCI